HKVAVMYAGEIVEAASATRLFAAPHHPYTRGLMASIPVPGKTPPGGRLGTIPGTGPVPVGDMRGCAFRPRCRPATAVCADPIASRSDGEHQWQCVLPELPVGDA